MADESNEEYLGDGAYVKFNGWEVVIYTSDGVNVTNAIYLGPSETSSLANYIERLAEAMKPEVPDAPK